MTERRRLQRQRRFVGWAEGLGRRPRSAPCAATATRRARRPKRAKRSRRATNAGLARAFGPTTQTGRPGTARRASAASSGDGAATLRRSAAVDPPPSLSTKGSGAFSAAVRPYAIGCAARRVWRTSRHNISSFCGRPSRVFYPDRIALVVPTSLPKRARGAERAALRCHQFWPPNHSRRCRAADVVVSGLGRSRWTPARSQPFDKRPRLRAIGTLSNPRRDHTRWWRRPRAQGPTRRPSRAPLPSLGPPGSPKAFLLRLACRLDSTPFLGALELLSSHPTPAHAQRS